MKVVDWVQSQEQGQQCLSANTERRINKLLGQFLPSFVVFPFNISV